MLVPGKKPEPETLASNADSAALGVFVNHRIDIEPIKDTRLVQINFDSTSPQLSARVANAIADNFIAANLEHNFNSSAYARRYLEGRLAQLKQKLADSETQLVAVADQQKIFLGPDGKTSLPAQNLAELNSALSVAQDGRIRAESPGPPASSKAGVARPGAIAVEPERERYIGLLGLACDFRVAAHQLGFSNMRASIDSACTGKPSARAIRAPDGASSMAASGEIRTSLKWRRKCRNESPEAKRAEPPVGSTWLEPAT